MGRTVSIITGLLLSLEIGCMPVNVKRHSNESICPCNLPIFTFVVDDSSALRFTATPPDNGYSLGGHYYVRNIRGRGDTTYTIERVYLIGDIQTN